MEFYLNDGKQVSLVGSEDYDASNLKNQYNVGIMLSGGLDSCVLLSMLCENFDRQTYVVFTIDKPDGSAMWTEKILDYLSDRYPTNNYYQQIIQGGDEDETKELGITGKVGLVDIVNNYYNKFGILYSGNTENPPIELDHNTAEPDRNAALRIQEKWIGEFILPFAHLNKSHTVELAHKFNFDHVFTMTHTCTERPRGRCGVCWQCRERQWGFSENNLQDPGKL